jgi:hypothetical protein
LLVNKGKLKPFEFQSVDNNFISRILFWACRIKLLLAKLNR